MTAEQAPDVGLAEVLAAVRDAHPVLEYRPCGRRVAEHPSPPPGPPDPPRGCARPADGHSMDECRTYDGLLLRAFARPETPIVETEPRVFYECQTCPREQQDRTSPTPCRTLAALAALAPVVAAQRDAAVREAEARALREAAEAEADSIRKFRIAALGSTDAAGSDS